MEKKEHILLRIIISFSFLLKPIASVNDDCLPSSACGPHEPDVRFPFRIVGRQPARCGFPGFDLSCNELNLTIIRLPSSRSYIVNRISYVSQIIYIDPEFCRPNGIINVNVSDTPFNYSILWMKSYTFYNCSLQNSGFMYPGVPFPCLSSGNYSVFAASIDSRSVPSICKVMKTIMVPIRSNSDIREGLELVWFTPSCGSCERKGDVCGWRSDDGHIICVSSSSSSSRGITRIAKYSLFIGIGVPSLICIIGLVCYASFKIQGYNNTHNRSIDFSSITVIPQLASRTGLDRHTIESYPKTVLGESYRLPNDDATCAICLSGYKPKESLRTIPECNHYFHSECIDKWLMLNATCPMCRNTSEGSALVTVRHWIQLGRQHHQG